jgi:hypothetical protein
LLEGSFRKDIEDFISDDCDYQRRRAEKKEKYK